MRIALVSPFPPARTGIADYSAALCAALGTHVEVEVIGAAPSRFDAARYDAIVYQMGNNPWHVFAYDLAIQHPGVTVMHEANLHHLMTDVTIRRGRWDEYLVEAEYNGGPAALAFAQRVRALETGPDYDNLPMTRRLLERSRGLVVHSRCVGRQMREQGFRGPIAVIPHGAWIPDVDRLAARQCLGLDERTPLIGVFGFLKPYKRIAESLRAFRRLLRFEPSVKLLLAGEVHPDFPLHSMVNGMGLGGSVRITGHLPIAEFETSIAACDIVLNLRYPTVGETSGTLLRSLGLGRAVIVSDIGSFSELPGDICLKAPVDNREEDTLFEYLHLLVEHRDLAQALGERARAWVRSECSWDHAARKYVEFLSALREGHPWPDFDQAALPAAPLPAPEPIPVPMDYVAGWAADDGARDYIETHKSRLEKTLEMIPLGAPEDRILEMGAYLQITPALQTRLGYGEVRACYYGPAGRIEHKRVVSAQGEEFECSVEMFDAEKDVFPYPDEYFATILCCELLEHLPADPMHMMAEINRILKPGGHLLLTTPNIASTRAIAAILRGYHPGFFPAYLKPELTATDARHNREYTPNEIWQLFYYSGLDTLRLETGEFQDAPHPQHHYIEHMLKRYGLPTDLRGDGIYALGRKSGPVRERFPDWLYSGGIVSGRTLRFTTDFSPADGAAAGWQIYDPASDFFLSEGEWRPAPSSGPIEWEVELPEESGPYRVYVSPVDPARGWLYARGGRFLVIDAVVENGVARVIDSRTTTLSALRWQHRLSAWKPLLLGPLQVPWRNRALISSMVRRDVSARYRGSFGDLLWTFLNPLLLMAAYYFVFGLVLRARFPGDPSASGFVLYFLAGMMPWLAFSEAVGRAPTLLLEHRNFVKKILFPIETLPVQVTLTGLVTQLVATAIFLFGLLSIRGAMPPSAIWFPLLLIPQILLTVGLCWLLASLGAFLRDLAQVIGFVLTLWFFLTPICYPEASLPKAAWVFLRFNPLVHLVRAYRSVLLEGTPPELDKLAWLYLTGLALAWFGHATFYKLRKSFADVL